VLLGSVLKSVEKFVKKEATNYKDDIKEDASTIGKSVKEGNIDGAVKGIGSMMVDVNPAYKITIAADKKIAKVGENLAISTANSIVQDTKSARTAVRKDAKAASKDWAKGDYLKAVGAAGKLTGSAIQVGVDGGKNVPIVGTIITSSEGAVTHGIKTGEDVGKIYDDAKKEGLKKSLKQNGKQLAKDAGETVLDTAQAVGTALIIPTGLGLGGAVVAAAGQAGFLAQGVVNTAKDSESVYKVYKKDKKAGVSKKQMTEDMVKGGVTVLADVAGSAAMGGMAVESGLGRGALAELKVGELSTDSLSLNPLKTVNNIKTALAERANFQEAVSLAAKESAGTLSEGEAAQLQQVKGKLSDASRDILDNQKDSATYKDYEEKIELKHKIGKVTNVAFAGQFATQDASSAIGTVQQLSKDKKYLKEDKATLKSLEQNGAAAEDIAEQKEYIKQDKDMLEQDKAGILGSTIKVAGDLTQLGDNTLFEQNALSMGGAVISQEPAMYQAYEKYKKDKKNGASSAQLKADEKALKGNILATAGGAAGSYFDKRMGITMTAQSVGQSIANAGYKMMDSASSSNNQSSGTPSSSTVYPPAA
jgi:hypothetical protein